MNLREYRDFCVKMMVGYAALGGVCLGYVLGGLLR